MTWPRATMVAAGIWLHLPAQPLHSSHRLVRLLSGPKKGTVPLRKGDSPLFRSAADRGSRSETSDLDWPGCHRPDCRTRAWNPVLLAAASGLPARPASGGRSGRVAVEVSPGSASPAAAGGDVGHWHFAAGQGDESLVRHL